MSSTPSPNNQDDELAGTEQPFMEHLIELRTRLIRAVLSIAVVAIALAIWPGANQLFDWLAWPLVSHLPNGEKMIAIGVISPFMTPLKVMLMTALVIALPVVLYQVWAFVAPGLYRSEKRLVLPLVISSTLLFFLGMAFCYFFVFGKVFTFILHFAPQSITYAPDIDQYLSFALTLFLAFGIAFEVPIVVVVLVSLGVVSVEKLKEVRGYVIVSSFIVAAIVTPPDVISQLLLAIPMCLLYEIGIWVSKLARTKSVDGQGAPERSEKESA